MSEDKEIISVSLPVADVDTLDFDLCVRLREKNRSKVVRLFLEAYRRYPDQMTILLTGVEVE